MIKYELSIQLFGMRMTWKSYDVGRRFYAVTILPSIFLSVNSTAAINGYASSSLHWLDRRTRLIQNGKRHGPFGRFMADNCRLYETVGHFRFCLNFFAEVIYLERTNEWKFYPTNTKGMTITTKTIGPSAYDAHSNIYSDFYFYRFLFGQKEATTMLFFSL